MKANADTWNAGWNRSTSPLKFPVLRKILGGDFDFMRNFALGRLLHQLPRSSHIQSLNSAGCAEFRLGSPRQGGLFTRSGGNRDQWLSGHGHFAWWLGLHDLKNRVELSQPQHFAHGRGWVGQGQIDSRGLQRNQG